MMSFLRTRLFILLPLILTLLALYGLLSRQAYDGEWMLRWNHVDTTQVQLVYAVISGVLLLALPFAPRISRALGRGRVVVLVLAAVGSFLSISLLEPNQEHRLFINTFSLWMIIAHILTVSAVFVWVATTADQGEAHAFTAPACTRYLLLLAIGLLTILHILSVGEFMALDLPDEPWLTSMATNYAENNDLSPSFIGSSYGTPDPILPRYYAVMGFWLRLAGSSLVALRLMPLLVLAVVLAIVVVLLWSQPLTTVQRLAGVLVLLSLSPLVRMSHNLRADVGLAVYGAIMLWAALNLFTERPSKRWGIIGGLALYLGLETIPFITLILAAVIGVMLVLWLLRHRRLRKEWAVVVLYAVCCALALGLYVAVRFLPDVQASWLRYQRFNMVYAQQTGFGTLRFPLESLITYHLRFSLILSPVECVAILGTLIVGWRWGTTAFRWTLLTFGLALGLMLTAVSFTYGYWVIFAPLVAYVAASVFTSRRVLALAVVMLPALIAAPVLDLATAVQTRPNQAALQAVESLAPRIPTATTVVGESILWFPLHTQRTFIGVDGFWINLSGHPERSLSETVDALDVDVLICQEGNEACNPIIASGLFSPPETYTTNTQTYLLYWRSR